MNRQPGNDRSRTVLRALMPTLFSIFPACGGGGGSGGGSADPVPSTPDPAPTTASITSFAVSPDTVDLRDTVTFEWTTDPPDSGNVDFTLELTGHGNVTGHSPLTIEDIRFGGTYTLHMTRGDGSTFSREVSLEIRPESVPQGFVGTVGDNLLVWHGWKLDHKHSPRTDRDYIRMFYEHGIVQDVFDWIVFIDGVESTEHYNYAASFGVVNTQDDRGFTDQPLPIGAQSPERLHTERLRGVISVATNRHTAYSLVHEIMHQWAADITALRTADDQRRNSSHWGFSDVHGPLGGFDGDTLRVFDAARDHHAARAFSNVGGAESNDLLYSPLEMYLAGWGPLSDVPPIKVAHNADWLRNADNSIVRSNDMDYTEYVFHAPDDFTTYDRDWLIETLGQREPPLGEAQTDFRLLFVYMVDQQFPAQIGDLARVSDEIAHMTQHAGGGDDEIVTFWQAAHGMATIRGDGLSEVLDQTIEPGQHTVVCHFRYSAAYLREHGFDKLGLEPDLCEGAILAGCSPRTRRARRRVRLPLRSRTGLDACPGATERASALKGACRPVSTAAGNP